MDPEINAGQEDLFGGLADDAGLFDEPVQGLESQPSEPTPQFMPAVAGDPREAVLLEAYRANPQGTLDRLLGGQQGQQQVAQPTPSILDDPELLNRVLSDPREVLLQVMAEARQATLAEINPTFQAASNISMVDQSIAANIPVRYSGTPAQMQLLRTAQTQALAQLRQSNPGVFQNPDEAVRTVQGFLDMQAFNLGMSRKQTGQPNMPVQARPNTPAPVGAQGSSGSFQFSSAAERNYAMALRDDWGMSPSEIKATVMQRRGAVN